MSKSPYYSHDCDMWNDPKIIKVRRKHGIAGYGLVNRLNELLFIAEHNRIGLDDETLDDIIYDLQDETVVTREVLDDVILHYKLYEREDGDDDNDTGYFYSKRMRRNIEKMNEIKQKRSYAGQMSGKSRQVINTSSTLVQQKRTIKKKSKSKVKDIINISFEDFWNLYDKKVGNRSKVESKWQSLSDNNRILAMEHIPLYIKSTPEKQYRKDPTTYLNNTGWTDEIINKSNGIEKFKLDSTGFPMAYCSICGISESYRKEELNQDSRCCKGKLLDKKPIAKHEG